MKKKHKLSLNIVDTCLSTLYFYVADSLLHNLFLITTSYTGHVRLLLIALLVELSGQMLAGTGA